MQLYAILQLFDLFEVCLFVNFKKMGFPHQHITKRIKTLFEYHTNSIQIANLARPHRRVQEDKAIGAKTSNREIPYG